MTLHETVVWRWTLAKGSDFMPSEGWQRSHHVPSWHPPLALSCPPELQKAPLTQPPVVIGHKIFLLVSPGEKCCLLCSLAFETCVSWQLFSCAHRSPNSPWDYPNPFLTLRHPPRAPATAPARATSLRHLIYCFSSS